MKKSRNIVRACYSLLKRKKAVASHKDFLAKYVAETQDTSVTHRSMRDYLANIAASEYRTATPSLAKWCEETINKIQSRVDKFGEVMTPPSLVNEMLDSLPEEVWKNPDYKWIDNSCGTGNILVGIKERLLKYHSAEHVLSNMVYGIDIQQDNVDRTKERLGGGNIICQDALKWEPSITDNWHDGEFNIVVGNPPYNNERSGKSGNNCNPLWPDFVKSIVNNLLADDGYLCLVHPTLWRKPEHELWTLLRQYQFKKIKMFSLDATEQIFKCGTKVDYYVMQKTAAKDAVQVIGEDGLEAVMTVHDKPFIPNHSFAEVYDVFGGKTDVIYSCKYHHYTHDYVRKTKTDVYKYPCIYLVNKKGITYCYSSKNDQGHFGRKKIIIPMGRFEPILDAEGELGMCEVAFGIPIRSKEHGEQVMELFKSEKFKKVLSACKWKIFQLDYRLFKYLSA